METRICVNTYEVNIWCDECSKKPNPSCKLKFSGVVLTSFPPQYPHYCELCNKSFTLLKKYPYIEYKE